MCGGGGGCLQLAAYGSTVHFILMGNVLPHDDALPLSAVFDLKGSGVGRHAKLSPSGGAATEVGVPRSYSRLLS